MIATAAATALDQSGSRRRGQAFIALAAVAWSTAGVLQRQLSLDAATQVAGRALFATLALLVYVALDERPSTLILIGGAVVIAAIVIQTRGAPARETADDGAIPPPP